jgi:BlaI family penicillinase repressor
MKIEISDAEYQVMEVVWHQHSASAKQIILALNNDWHPKTVNTLLNRLVKKQALGFEKEGRSYVYRALVNRANYINQKSQRFLQKLFGGKISPLVANFVDQDMVQKEDIEDLKKLISDWESNND